MSAHVSASPNHQTGRVNSLHTRGIVAMGGSFGYELDISTLSNEEKEEIARQVKEYRACAGIIRNGNYYRLISTPDVYAWETAAADRSTVLVSCCVIHTRVQQTLIVKLRGLDENAWYHDPESGNIYSGGMLMHAGLNLSALRLRDRDAVMIRLEKI